MNLIVKPLQAETYESITRSKKSWFDINYVKTELYTEPSKRISFTEFNLKIIQVKTSSIESEPIKPIGSEF